MHRPWERAASDGEAASLVQTHVATAGEAPLEDLLGAHPPLPACDELARVEAAVAAYALSEVALRTYVLLTALARDRALFLAVRHFAAWNRVRAVPVRLAVRIANPFAAAPASALLLPDALVPRFRQAGVDYWALATAEEEGTETIVPLDAPPPVEPRPRTDALPSGLLVRVPPRDADEVPLVLTRLAEEGLAHVRARVRHRAQVTGLGQGLFVLLAGPAGHGRKSAARRLATELGLELWAVRSGALTSPWAGETEQRVSALFARMAASGAALLIEDAADLFAPRTEVTRSIDRYANLTTNHLLQAVDSFPGVCFLTATGSEGFDPAMRRRVAVSVVFGAVDAAHVLESAARWLFARAPIEPAQAPEWRELGALAANIEPAGIVRLVMATAFDAVAGGGRLTHDRLAARLRREVELRGGVIRTDPFRSAFSQRN